MALLISTAHLCFTAAWTGRGETHLSLLNIGIYSLSNLIEARGASDFRSWASREGKVTQQCATVL